MTNGDHRDTIMLRRLVWIVCINIISLRLELFNYCIQNLRLEIYLFRGDKMSGNRVLLLKVTALTIAIILLFFAFCDEKKEISQEEKLAQLESIFSWTNVNTFNYCFYVKNSTKILTLNFGADVSLFDINNAKLYSDENIVCGDVDIVSKKLNKIEITISEFIEKFDTIRLYDNNQEFISVYVGQHYFELLSPDIASSSTLPDFTVTERGKTLDIDLSVKQFGNITYEFIVPKLMNNLSFSESTFDNDNKNAYNLKQVITLTDEIDTMSGLSFEFALVEKSVNDNKCVLGIAQIPIIINE